MLSGRVEWPNPQSVISPAPVRPALRIVANPPLGCESGSDHGLLETFRRHRKHQCDGAARQRGRMRRWWRTRDLTILIDPRATMFSVGTQVDDVEDKLQSGFVFRNPSEKFRCDCGESFHV